MRALLPERSYEQHFARRMAQHVEEYHMLGLRGGDTCVTAREGCVIYAKMMKFYAPAGFSELEKIEYLTSQRGVRNYTPIFHTITTCGLKT